MDVGREVEARLAAYLDRAWPGDCGAAARGLLRRLRGLGGHRFMLSVAAFDAAAGCQHAVSRYAGAGDGAAVVARRRGGLVLLATACWCADRPG